VIGGSWVHLKGIEECCVPMNTKANNGFANNGSNNILELLNAHNNQGSGIQVGSGSGTKPSIVIRTTTSIRVQQTEAAPERMPTASVCTAGAGPSAPQSRAAGRGGTLTMVTTSSATNLRSQSQLLAMAPVL